MNLNNQKMKRTELDILRGIGITGIVLYHLFPGFFRGGFLGVPLFFVLSGYLMFITSEKDDDGSSFQISTYYKKRVRKIIPPMFTMVMAVCCYLTLTHSSRMIGMRHEVASIFLGYDNWWQIRQNASYFSLLADGSPFTHLWFLAVEIQFYVIWPFIFLLYRKGCKLIGGRKMCFAFLFAALLSIGKMWYLYTPGGDPSRVYYGTDTMAFSLLIGIFLGAFRQQYKGSLLPEKIKIPQPVLHVFFILIICVLFLTVDGQIPFLYQGGMFLISVFYALMIHLITSSEPPVHTSVPSSFLSLLGRKSYGIYLWHYPIIILALI